MTTDELMVAQSIANSIVTHGAAKAFTEGTDELRKEMILAYMDLAIKKFDSFQAKFLTNPEAKEAFCLKIHTMI